MLETPPSNSRHRHVQEVGVLLAVVDAVELLDRTDDREEPHPERVTARRWTRASPGVFQTDRAFVGDEADDPWTPRHRRSAPRSSHDRRHEKTEGWRHRRTSHLASRERGRLVVGAADPGLVGRARRPRQVHQPDLGRVVDSLLLLLLQRRREQHAAEALGAEREHGQGEDRGGELAQVGS